MLIVRNKNDKPKEENKEVFKKDILDSQEENKIIEALRFCAR